MRSKGIFPVSRVRVRDCIRLIDKHPHAPSGIVLWVLKYDLYPYRDTMRLELLDEATDEYYRIMVEVDDLVEIMRR